MNDLISDWMKNIKLYPPSELFFEKYGKDAKAEKRIQEICEDLYRFNYPDNQVNYLGELVQAYREFEVAYKMGFDGMKSSYIIKVKDKFLSTAKDALNAFETMTKKDQLLQAYYKPWKIKYQEIDREIFNLTKDYLTND